MKTTALRHRRATESSGQRWLAAVVALCFFLSQALWLLHRVAHVGIATHATAVSGKGQSSAAPTAHKSGAWVKALLPDHPDERSCAQYDQLGHADLALGSQTLEVTFAKTTLAQATHVASSMAAQAAGFLARGPPATA
jgi:hypothetical protein